VAYTELNKILLAILLGESGNDIPIIPDPEKDFLQRGMVMIRGW